MGQKRDILTRLYVRPNANWLSELDEAFFRAAEDCAPLGGAPFHNLQPGIKGVTNGTK